MLFQACGNSLVIDLSRRSARVDDDISMRQPFLS